MRPHVTVRKQKGRGTVLRVSAKTRIPYWRRQKVAYVGYSLVPGLEDCLVLAVSYPSRFVQSTTDIMRWLPHVNWVAPVTMTNGERKHRGPWCGLEVYLPQDLDAPAPGRYICPLKKKDTTERMPIICLVIPMK